MESYKILANCTVTKLKELSKSYGKPEEIQVPFIFDFEDKIYLINSAGYDIRTMKKGTKLLKSYTGTEISERTYKIRVNKSVKLHKDRVKQQQAIQQAQEEALHVKITNQTKLLREEFIKNPEFLGKITNRIQIESNKHWRGWVKMKVCARLFNGCFKDMSLNPTIIRDTAFSLVNKTYKIESN